MQISCLTGYSCARVTPGPALGYAFLGACPEKNGPLGDAVKYRASLYACSISQMKWTGVSSLGCISRQSPRPFIIVLLRGLEFFFFFLVELVQCSTAICSTGCVSCLFGMLSSRLRLRACLLTSWRARGLKNVCLLKIKKLRASFARGALSNICGRAAPAIC